MRLLRLRRFFVFLVVVFLALSPVRAVAAGTVSDGDSALEEFDVPVPFTPLWTLYHLPNALTWVGRDDSSVLSSIFVDMGAVYNGIYKFSFTVTPTWIFKVLPTSMPADQLGVMVRWYVQIDDTRYYALNSTGTGPVRFEFIADLTNCRTFCIGYEGSVILQKDALTNASARVQLECSFMFHDYDETRIMDRSTISMLRGIFDRVGTLISTTIPAVTKGINDATAARFKELRNLLDGHFGTIGTYIDNTYKGLKATLNDNFRTIHSDLVSFMEQNHGDIGSLSVMLNEMLTRLDLDLVSIRSRLDLIRSDLMTYFNRQHQDFLDLIEELTRGYDPSSGNESNDDLSDSFGKLDDLESGAISDAGGSLKDFDPGSIFDFTGYMFSAMSFMGGFVDSFFVISGPLSTIPTVLYVMAFLVVVVGLWRYRK